MPGFDVSNEFTPLVLHRHGYTSLLNNPANKAPFIAEVSRVLEVQKSREHLHQTLAICSSVGLARLAVEPPIPKKSRVDTSVRKNGLLMHDSVSSL